MAAVKDLSGGWREIKFQGLNSNSLIDQERVLHTNLSAQTSIAVENPMDNEFYSYQPGWLRKFLRRPKYFVIEFTAMVGERKYSVATVY